MSTDFLATLQNFRHLRILVVGDLMLDHYITGTTERTSPEAPVPVVLVSGETYMAGGAANVARNISAAGADALACGATGDDEAGRMLLDRLVETGVDVSGIACSASCATILKTRIVSQGQQIVRLDREKLSSVGEVESGEVLRYLDQVLSSVQAVIISDYGKGFLNEEILKHLISRCAELSVPVLVDPKGMEYSRYRGAFAITPNSREAHAATGFATANEDGLRKAAEAIREITGCSLVVITRGADGLAISDAPGVLRLIPTSAREVYDVTGAGDTFVAWLAMGIAAGLPAEDAAGLANIAAGISVGRSGPAAISPLDIRQALAPGKLGKKIINESDLAELGKQLHESGKKIVLTNGCFDFLHAGHVAFLQQAKAVGDVLVLATNTDACIAKLKGAPRPIIGQRQREELLASIEAVDYVTAFAGETPHEIIRALRPDVLVKGANYTMEQVEGAELIREQGGDVVILPIIHDIKTSRLLGEI